MMMGRRLSGRCRHLFAPVRNASGLSILELLIAVLIGSFVIYAGLETFVTMNHQTIWQEQITDAQQSARAVQRVMSEHLRMAGFGIPRILAPVTGSDSPNDTIVISHQDPEGCEAFLSADMADAADPIVVDGYDISCVEDGMWMYIHDPAVDSGEFFQVLSKYDSPPSLEAATALGRAYAAGSGVYHINQMTYYIDDSDPDHPTLMQKPFGEAATAYADDIESLHCAYVMQNGDTVQVPIDPYMVTNVLIDLTARSAREDKDIEHDYRRRSLAFNVSVRNLEF